MPPLTAVRQEADVKVYHCGNFLGLWAPGASWWCRRCRKLIHELPLNRWEIDTKAVAEAQ